MDIFIAQFFTVALVHLLAVASPGPDFAIVVKNSLRYGKRTAIFTSIGIGTAILIHMTYCLLGIGLIISKSIILFSIMKYLAAAYLIYIGIKSLRAKPQNNTEDSINVQDSISDKKAFISGFVTNGLNPKATLFFLALFTVIMRRDTPLYFQAAYGIYMSIATMAWFSMLSLVFGSMKVRRVFSKMGHWVDRVMGGVLVLLAIKIAAAKPE